MGIERTACLKCDGCGTAHDYMHEDCQGTAKRLRKSAKADGWMVNVRRGRAIHDYCSDCWDRLELGGR